MYLSVMQTISCLLAKSDRAAKRLLETNTISGRDAEIKSEPEKKPCSGNVYK